MSTSVFWLDEDPSRFPDYQYALDEPNGLLAAGGDLSPQRLLTAYQLGIFPWFSEDDPILWWSPDPRCVITPADFKPSRSLRKFMNKTDYQITINQDFKQVMESCAAPRANQDGTWISQEMMDAYTELNRLGFAHSIEYRINGELLGGLYGLAIGGAFFGESMFSFSDNASKVAFANLCTVLNENGFSMVDCQVYSDHLNSLGAIEISRDEFLSKLNLAIQLPTGPWISALEAMK